MTHASYFADLHKNTRAALGLLVEDMHPREVSADDYAKQLARFDREYFEAERLPVPKVYATCLECFGDGRVQNPKWFDDDECQEPESLGCDTCCGVGIVEIVDPPSVQSAAPVLDDDVPF